LVPVDFGRTDEPEITKKQLASQLDKSGRWIEQRMAEGMPSRLAGNRRMFLATEVRAWLAEHRPDLRIRAELERKPIAGRRCSKTAPTTPERPLEPERREPAVEAQIILLRSLKDDLDARIAALEGGHGPAA
jgi:hypothetical protein